MKKLLLTMGLAGAMTAGFAMTGFAGEWRLDNVGYWWQNDDGSYPASTWQWLDGNRDGVAECYYFGQDGYMVANTEIDGYQVNGDGAWVVDGVVQTRAEAGTDDIAARNREVRALYKKFLEENGANPSDSGSSRQFYDEHQTDYFWLLDINQDGIDELLCGADEAFSGITVYAGEKEIYGADYVNNVIYDAEKKVLEVPWYGRAGGLEMEDALFFDGSSWKAEHVSYNPYIVQINPGDPLLSFSEFCSVTDIYEGAQSELYVEYKKTWEEVTAFRKKYDYYGSRNKMYPRGVKNTISNREYWLK